MLPSPAAAREQLLEGHSQHGEKTIKDTWHNIPLLVVYHMLALNYA
jgi:hypothetical protein